MITLVVTKGHSSMDQYSFWLSRFIDLQILSTDIYQRSCEQFNIGWAHPKALMTFFLDLRFISRIRRVKGVIHLPNQHLGRYAHFLSTPFVITAHDVIRLLDLKGWGPYIHRPNARDAVYLKLDFSALSKAARIIAPSNHTKGDLIKHLNIPEDKIAVIPHGVDMSTFRPLKGRRPCAEPYILYVGSEHPRKNLATLFRAFRELKRERQFRTLKLVKAGRPGGREHEFRSETLAMIRDLGVEGDVIIEGFKSREELVSLYSQAEVFAFPSLYEGFGWPPLEAMACACPVVASTATSVPEVVGDAAMLKHPQDVDAWADGLGRVLTDRETRRRLVQRGMERAKDFPWERAVRLTKQVYDEVERQLGPSLSVSPSPGISGPTSQR